MTGVLPLSTAWCASFQYERRTTSRYSGSTYSVQISSGSLMCASQSKTGNVLVTRCCPLVTLMGRLRGRRDTPRLPPSCLVRRKEAGQDRALGSRAGLRRDARDAERRHPMVSRAIEGQPDATQVHRQGGETGIVPAEPVVVREVGRPSQQAVVEAEAARAELCEPPERGIRISGLRHAPTEHGRHLVE